MPTEIYSRKTIARVGACLVFAVYGGIAVSFLRDYPKHLTPASGGNLIVVAIGGVLMFGCILVLLDAAIRVFRPTIVEGALVRNNGDFVRREHNGLVICVEGRNYKFPLDSNVDAKLNGASAESIQVHMKVGAFGRPFYLEVR